MELVTQKLLSHKFYTEWLSIIEFENKDFQKMRDRQERH